jgi:hypothetical protein
MSVHATGGNYQIDLTKGIAVCRIWMRPDLGRDEGAALAQEKVTLLGKLAQGPRSMAKALLLNFKDAPTRWGPTTQEALEEICSAWETAGRRLGVLVAPDPLQLVLLKQLVQRSAPIQGRTFVYDNDAEAYCLGLGKPTTGPV